MTDIEENTPISPLVQFLMDCDGDEDKIGQTVIAVLELLTLRAADDCAYAIRSDDGKALFVVAVEDDAAMLEKALPEHFKDYADVPEEYKEKPDFATNVDPGDEQPDYEPAA